MKREDAVLALLRENPGRHVSGEVLCARMKVSRAAVWKGVEELRRLGYVIQALPSRGYRLQSVPDKLFSDEIRHGLKTKFAGKTIYSYDVLDSTNDAAFRLGEQGAPEGTCVFAEFQKKGRGRLGRQWSSPKGKNLLFSIILRPLLAPADVSKITLVAAVSLARAIRQTIGQNVGIKWPNDIVHGGAKLAGILTEMSAELDRVNFVVVGLGVNINASSDELPPGSVSMKKLARRALSRVDFARTLLTEIERDILRFKEGKFAQIAQEWEENTVTSGRRVVASVLGRKIHGQAEGIDEDGALWIRKDNGLKVRITSGDVEHLREAAAKGGRRAA